MVSKKLIENETVIKRLNGIQGELAELRKISEQTPPRSGRVFNIAGHILARIPGAQATKYKEMAQKLGEAGIIDRTFADTKLTEMAKYRNRLVHFYAEVMPRELFNLLRDDLGDFDIFLKAIKKVLENPERFGVEVD